MDRQITVVLDELTAARLVRAARELNCGSVEDAAAVLLGRALEEPPVLTGDRAAFEQEMLRALEGGPDVELGREDWARMERELIERHARSKAG